MKKVLIGIVVAIIIVVAVYFLLPQNMKNVIDYYRMKMFDKEEFAEIEVVQNTPVLGQDTITYGQIMDAVTAHEYWTYETNVTATGAYQKIIKANGDNVDITIGENSDGGIYEDATLQMVFTLDSQGGYDLTVYLDGTVIEKEDRDLLLSKMCTFVD